MTRSAALAWLLLVPACAADTGGAADSGSAATSTASSGETPDTWDTWDSFAKGFFADYCVECHTESPKDFTDPADIAALADEIRCGVATTALDGCADWPPPEQFPVGDGPFPSDSERDRIVAWIDAGMP